MQSSSAPLRETRISHRIYVFLKRRLESEFGLLCRITTNNSSISSSSRRRRRRRKSRSETVEVVVVVVVVVAAAAVDVFLPFVLQALIQGCTNFTAI